MSNQRITFFLVSSGTTVYKIVDGNILVKSTISSAP